MKKSTKAQLVTRRRFLAFNIQETLVKKLQKVTEKKKYGQTAYTHPKKYPRDLFKQLFFLFRLVNVLIGQEKEV